MQNTIQIGHHYAKKPFHYLQQVRQAIFIHDFCLITDDASKNISWKVTFKTDFEGKAGRMKLLIYSTWSNIFQEKGILHYYNFSAILKAFLLISEKQFR